MAVSSGPRRLRSAKPRCCKITSHHTWCIKGARFVVMHRVRPVTKKAGRQRKAAQRAHQSRQPRGAARLASAVTDETVTLDPAEVTERRRAATTCGWCGTPMQPKARGRIPKWCSPSCRQRAWEQARAAESGLAAVKVVERRVEVAAAPPRRPAETGPGCCTTSLASSTTVASTTATSPTSLSRSTPCWMPIAGVLTYGFEPRTSAPSTGDDMPRYRNVGQVSG
jgi:hypothetical protein